MILVWLKRFQDPILKMSGVSSDYHVEYYMLVVHVFVENKKSKPIKSMKICRDARSPYSSFCDPPNSHAIIYILSSVMK